MLAIYKLLYRFFFGFFYIYKNLHIEPFNYTIKIVCFGFGSTNVGSSVIKTLKKIIIAIFWPPKSEFDLVPIQKFLCCRSQNISCWAKCLVPYQKLICIQCRSQKFLCCRSQTFCASLHVPNCFVLFQMFLGRQKLNCIQCHSKMFCNGKKKEFTIHKLSFGPAQKVWDCTMNM